MCDMVLVAFKYLMRPVAAVSTCCSLLAAFCLAPFQHVHSHDGYASEIHAHFYALSDPELDSHGDDPEGARFESDDDHASARSLDTFTLTLAPTLTPFTLPQAQLIHLVRPVVPAPVEPVEACAHDPPAVRFSIPRAPPA
jgi:hypothetical protein